MNAGTNTSAIVDHYFEAWQKGDFDSMRPWLSDDFSFIGPLMQCDGADDYISKTKETAKQFAGSHYERVSSVVQGEHAVVLSTLAMGPVTLHTAEHFVVRDGKLASARLYFDPTPLHTLAGAPAAS